MKRLPLLALALSIALSACNSSSDSARSSTTNTGSANNTARIETIEIGDIPRLHAFGDVLLAGQPSADDFALLDDQGYKTIINLRRPEEKIGFDQARLLADLDIDYIHIPWNGPDELSDQVFDQLRELLTTAERPLVLHCASANRVGAVWLPWRVLDGGLSYEDALAEAKTIGMRTPGYEVKARDYIERHRQ